MRCAKLCGMDVPEVRLFPSEKGEGYFGVKRFDRVNEKRVHMITVSGLLETSHRVPNLDYHDLMRLTYILTNDRRQMEEMYIYSNSLGGEHATCVNGNGKSPEIEDLLEVGKATGLSKSTLRNIAEEIREIVKEEL